MGVESRLDPGVHVHRAGPGCQEGADLLQVEAVLGQRPLAAERSVGGDKGPALLYPAPQDKVLCSPGCLARLTIYTTDLPLGLQEPTPGAPLSPSKSQPPHWGPLPRETLLLKTLLKSPCLTQMPSPA